MDLPDGFFDRQTQFVINGAPFETLLGTAAERSADPDAHARARRLSIHRQGAAARDAGRADSNDGDDRRPTAEPARRVTIKLWLSGTLRGTGEAVNAVVPMSRCGWRAAGHVEIAEAAIDPSGPRSRSGRPASGLIVDSDGSFVIGQET